MDRSAVGVDGQKKAAKGRRSRDANDRRVDGGIDDMV